MKSRKKLETRFPKNSFKKIIGLIAFGSCLLGCATDTRQTSDLRNLQIKSNLNLNEDSAKVAELKRFQNNQILWEPKSEMSYTIAELLQDPVPDPYYLMALGEKNLKLVKNIARIYSSPKDNRPMFFDNPKDGAASSKRKKLEAPLAPPWSFVSLNNVSNLAYCDFGSAWTNVSHEFTTLLARRFKQLIGPLPLIPTTLKQDPYESRFNFQRRVASVAKKYNEEIREYNRRAQSYSISNSDQTRLLQGAFQSLFGNPIIKNTTYDPDHGTFTVELISDSPFAIDFKQFSVLDQKIPNISAKDFNSRIMESTPVILFQREGLDLAILKEGFIIDGKLYSAKPIAPQENPVELASANLRNLDTAFLSSPLKEKMIPSLENNFHSDVDKPLFPQKNERPNDFALVVGVESYRDQNIPEAEFATRDSSIVARYLMTLGVPKNHVILLEGENATSGEIESYLEDWLPKNVANNSRVYFYFSGHGSPDLKEHTAYLVPWDGDPKFLSKTAVSLKTVYSSLGKLKAKRVLIALDSCFSGSGGRSVIQSGVRPLMTVNPLRGVISQNITTVLASKSNEIATSLEQEGHGLFTYYFLKGLNNNNHDAHRLCVFLKKNVPRVAALQNQTQIPVCHGPNFKFW